MENATKALMIAGAVLITIMVITLGINLFGRGNQTVDSATADMDAAAIQAYNQKFTNYEGTNVSTTEVNELLTTALSHNQLQATQQTGRSVTVTVKDGTKELSKIDNKSTSVTPVTGSSRYTVKSTMTGGLITSIDVTKNK